MKQETVRRKRKFEIKNACFWSNLVKPWGKGERTSATLWNWKVRNSRVAWKERVYTLTIGAKTIWCWEFLKKDGTRRSLSKRLTFTT